VNRPRVLLVVPSLPSPIRSGDDLRRLGIAKALAQFSTVSVAALSGGTSSAPPFVDRWVSGEFASPDGPPIVRHLLEHPDDPFGPYAAPDVIAFLRAVVRDVRPDVVVFARLQTFRLAADVLDGLDVRAVLDLDSANTRVAAAIDSVSGSSPASRIHLRFNTAAARYEQRVVPTADAVWLCSRVEADEVARTTGVEAAVIANVVDVDAYAALGVQRIPGRILFPGAFGYLPNEIAAREIIDSIAPALPGSRFLLVGSHAPAWLRDGSWPNITVVGRVPSMVEYLASASAVIVPLRAGTGTRLKILEAMAAGAPVVSTEIGAEGLGLEPGRDYLQADSAADFVAAIRLLQDDLEGSARLSSRGREVVRERFSVDALVPVLAEQLGLLLAASRSR
jgi:glycosyltransferase involved in cell wall biosynthesis